MEERFQFINKNMDEVMTKCKPSFPNYPNYSVWRLLVKGWIEIVYEPRRIEMDSIFLKYMSNTRVNSILNDDKCNSSSRHNNPFVTYQLNSLKCSHMEKDSQEFFGETVNV